MSPLQPSQPALSRTSQWTRRDALRHGALIAAGGAAALTASTPLTAAAAETTGKAVRNGRIQQSVAHWCFETSAEKWTLDRTCQAARELGCKSVELVTSDSFPTLKQHGLTCAMVQIKTDPDPPFLKGFNNPDHWPWLVRITKDAIDAAAAFGAPNVICFTGYSAKDPTKKGGPEIPRDAGARNCVEGLKQVVGYAEQKKVTLCLEMLNSREDTHPMKGHPGYQGDHTDYCINDILKPVSSPRLKLLFDVYHVQVMDGDVIRRIRQQKEWLGHIHVAGNPGRGELDLTQEINYPPVMKALLEVGYQGFVGQEFIPTRNPLQSLREAVMLCDV